MVIITPCMFIPWLLSIWPMLKHCMPDNLASQGSSEPITPVFHLLPTSWWCWPMRSTLAKPRKSIPPHNDAYRLLLGDSHNDSMCLCIKAVSTMANHDAFMRTRLWAIMSSWSVLSYLKHDNVLLSICLICGICVYKIIWRTYYWFNK